MKKIIFVLGVSLVGFGVLTAQKSLANSTDKSMQQVEQTQKVERKKMKQRGKHQAKHSSMTAEQRVERLDRDLDLSPEQKKQMVEVYKRSQAESRETRRDNREKFQEERNNILTPAQRKVLEVKQEHNRTDMQRSNIDSSPNDRGERRQMMRQRN